MKIGEVDSQKLLFLLVAPLIKRKRATSRRDSLTKYLSTMYSHWEEHRRIALITPTTPNVSEYTDAHEIRNWKYEERVVWNSAPFTNSVDSRRSSILKSLIRARTAWLSSFTGITRPRKSEGCYIRHCWVKWNEKSPSWAFTISPAPPHFEESVLIPCTVVDGRKLRSFTSEYKFVRLWTSSL